MPQAPRLEFHGSADPSDPEFAARMEEFGRRMEEWGKKYGEQYAAQAQAWAETARNAPEVIQSCDESEQSRTRTADGRPRVVICQRQIQLAAQTGLRNARNAIAGNRAISDEVRSEILRDLDKEIERIEREND
jgi:erythromycin esterase-like protein